MTENQNNNADGEWLIPTPGNGQGSGTSSRSSTPGATGPATSGADTPQSHDMNDLDAAWAAFKAEHQADLHDVTSSKQAKGSEEQAKKREKRALLSVDDLDVSSFADDTHPSRDGKKGKQPDPRDFIGSSWLDTDNVMDAYDGGGFTPPNSGFSPVKASTVLLMALLIIGLTGGTVMIFIPSLNAVPLLGTLLNTLFGLGVTLGLGGLVAKILSHKDHPGDQGGYYDDDARVQSVQVVWSLAPLSEAEPLNKQPSGLFVGEV